MLKWLIILVTIAMVIGMIALARAEELSTMYCISSDSYVNVRDRPSTKARIGGRLDFGDPVTVSGSERDGSGTVWYRVEGITEQGYGYVCANYLVPSQPVMCDKTATVSADGRVAVYKRVNGARKAWAKVGAVVRIRIMSADWCLTDRGWIRTEYLRVEED